MLNGEEERLIESFRMLPEEQQRRFCREVRLAAFKEQLKDADTETLLTAIEMAAARLRVLDAAEGKRIATSLRSSQ